METEKGSSKNNNSNGSSSLPKAIDPKRNGAKTTRTTASAPTAEAKNPPTDAASSKNKGPRRQSTRSVKAPKPFSPPMGGIKGVSSAAKKALASSSKNKGSLFNVSLNNPEHQRRFLPILYDLIEETHNENQDIISWSRDGKSFVFNTDHPDLEETIEGYFSHGRLRSLQRQLQAHGFVKEGDAYFHPQFHRGIDEEDMLAISRKSRIEIEGEEIPNGKKRKGSLHDDNSRAGKVFRRNSNASSKTNDGGDDMSTESLVNFAQIIHNMLEENKDPAIMKWTAGGKAFFVDPDHPDLGDVLEKYFHHRNFWSLKRQLNQYGWTKPKEGDYRGTLFNPAFYRNMPAENFDLIRRKDARNYIPLKQQLVLAEKNKKKSLQKKMTPKKKKVKKGDPILRVPPVPASAFAAARAAAKSTTATPPPPSAAAGKPKKKEKKVKKTAQKEASPTPTKKVAKKRKNASASSKENAERLKKIQKLSAEAHKAKDRVEHYKQLQGLYDAWTLFNMPAQLKSHIKKRSKKTWNVAAAAGGREGLGAIKPDARFLICEEEMPDWLAQDEKETLEELEEMIIRDRRQRQARQDAWSRKYSIAKGKTIPPSKFNRPTNKWKKVSPGDRIDVYWHDDKQYYTANVVKHQEGTSYFHLFYEEDGAMEWLDLSREDFNLIENQNRSSNAIPRGPSENGVTVKNTPRKDNRSLRPEPPSLPENHSHLAPFLRYSWDSLGLGKDLGTPAYNKFIKNRDPSATEVTPLEILQDVRALRTRGFSAQPDIDLRVNSDPTAVNNKLTTMLRDLQDDIAEDFVYDKSYKNFETTLSTVRKVTDHWEVPELVGNMQRLETRVATMDEREARLMEKLRRKGLI